MKNVENFKIKTCNILDNDTLTIKKTCVYTQTYIHTSSFSQFTIRPELKVRRLTRLSPCYLWCVGDVHTDPERRSKRQQDILRSNLLWSTWRLTLEKTKEFFHLVRKYKNDGKPSTVFSVLPFIFTPLITKIELN